MSVKYPILIVEDPVEGGYTISIPEPTDIDKVEV